MDNSKEFQIMLDGAISIFPKEFSSFDRTKNVQDQIQEMIDYEDDKIFPCSCLGCVLEGIAKFAKTVMEDSEIDSMEQLWLAFYMHEKHSKIWDGGKWVKKQKTTSP